MSRRPKKQPEPFASNTRTLWTCFTFTPSSVKDPFLHATARLPPENLLGYYYSPNSKYESYFPIFSFSSTRDNPRLGGTSYLISFHLVTHEMKIVSFTEDTQIQPPLFKPKRVSSSIFTSSHSRGDRLTPPPTGSHYPSPIINFPLQDSFEIRIKCRSGQL